MSRGASLGTLCDRGVNDCSETSSHLLEWRTELLVAARALLYPRLEAVPQNVCTVVQVADSTLGVNKTGQVSLENIGVRYY